MNQNNQDTNDILDAIKSMMSNDHVNSEQKLPKEVIELTKPIDNKEDKKIDDSILELTELVTEDQENSESLAEEKKKDIQIEVNQIRGVIRRTIESLPENTINDIINEELKRVVLEKLSESKIIISSQDNKK